MRLKGVMQKKPDVYCHLNLWESYLHVVRENMGEGSCKFNKFIWVNFSKSILNW